MKKSDIVRIIGVILIVIGLLITTFSYYKMKYEEKETLIDIDKYMEETTIDDEEIDETLIEEDNTEPDKTDSDKSLLMVLEIPKIEFKRGIYKKESKYNNVKYNIQILKDSSTPEVKNGNVIIAGHNGNSKVAFFKNLNKLNVGDYVYIYYNGEKYSYKLDSIYLVQKDGMAEIYRYKDKNTITLVTCNRKKRDKQEIYIGYLETKEKY